MRAQNSRRCRWVVLSAVMLAGLGNATSAPLDQLFLARIAATGDGSDSDSGFDNLELVDPGLKGKVEVLRVGTDVGDISSEAGKNKLLSVFAGLRNKTDHKLVLELETIYKDKDDNALNSGSWFVMTLKPHEEKEYHSASISMQAVNYLIRVRRSTKTSTSD